MSEEVCPWPTCSSSRTMGVSAADVITDILSRIVEAPQSPALRGILASHRVPLGKTYRQWDTHGRFWLWCNRGEIAQLRPLKVSPVSDRISTADGIPVYWA